MTWEAKWAACEALRARLSGMSYDELCSSTTRALKKEFDLSGHTIGALLRDEMRGRRA